jgi:hypothetical protein
MDGQRSNSTPACQSCGSFIRIARAIPKLGGLPELADVPADVEKGGAALLALSR